MERGFRPEIKNPFIDQDGKRPWHERFARLANGYAIWIGDAKLRGITRFRINPYREHYREKLNFFTDPAEAFKTQPHNDAFTHQGCHIRWLGVASSLPDDWSAPDSCWNDWFHILHWSPDSKTLLTVPTIHSKGLENRGNSGSSTQTLIPSINPHQAFEIVHDYLESNPFNPVALFRLFLKAR